MTLPLDTASGPSPDAEAERNVEISRHKLRQAREELAKADLLQASEKAWGAAAYAVKAVAEKRCWFNEADWKLEKIATIIADEQGDPGILGDYLAARRGHYNFYHHEFSAWQVERIIDHVAELITKLDVVLAPGYAPPYVSPAVEAEIRRLEQPTSERDYTRLEEGRPPISERPPAMPETSPHYDQAQI